MIVNYILLEEQCLFTDCNFQKIYIGNYKSHGNLTVTLPKQSIH